jgi:hypothetical protein
MNLKPFAGAGVLSVAVAMIHLWSGWMRAGMRR